MSYPSSLVRKENLQMAHCYMAMTVLFYVLLPVAFDCAPLHAVGGHASYYALMWGLRLEDSAWVAVPVLQKIFAFIAIAYPIALIVCYIVLLRKRSALPFGILTVFSWLLTFAMLPMSVVMAIVNKTPLEFEPLFWWFDAIGNAVFCYYYFVFYRGKR